MIDAIILVVEYVAGVLGVPAALVHAVAVAAVLSVGCLGVIGKERRRRLMGALRKAGRRMRGKGGTASAVLAAALVLGGCAAFDSNKLGETSIETQFQGTSVERMKAADDVAAKLSKAGLDGEQIKAVFASVTRPLPSKISLSDGKDKATVDWEVNIAEGTATYNASEVGATDPAKVKATIAENAGDDLVKSIENGFPGGIEGLVEKLSSAGVL